METARGERVDRGQEIDVGGWLGFEVDRSRSLMIGHEMLPLTGLPDILV